MPESCVIENNFMHHAPTKEKIHQHETVRKECKALAYYINKLPETREKSLALTKLEECMMWTNAAIARY